MITKYLRVFCTFVLGVASGFAAELNYRNSNFDVVFETRGATVKKLVCKGEDWNAAYSKVGNSFADFRLGCNKSDNEQVSEDFSALEWAIDSWKLTGRDSAKITFSACGRLFPWLRISKTYEFSYYKPNELRVDYLLENQDSKNHSISLNQRNFFHRTTGSNLHWQPTAEGGEKLIQRKSYEFIKNPPRCFSAITSEDNSGLLVRMPRKHTAGILNWFCKEGFATTEYFSDEVSILANGSCKLQFILAFSKDISSLFGGKELVATVPKGKTPCVVNHLNEQESSAYKTYFSKPEAPADANFYDITLNRQFADSWRSVTLPAGCPVNKIAVFLLENGFPSFDRPVEYALNGQELLLKIPGLNPDTGAYVIRNGFYTRHGDKDQYYLGPVSITCRIFTDREDGKRSADKAPAGGELVLNGNFEEGDPQKPENPRYGELFMRKSAKTEWLANGGQEDSRCLKGGSAEFYLIPEKNVGYKITADVKSVGNSSRARIWVNYYDKDGKKLDKHMVWLGGGKDAFDWKTFSKTVYAPEDAVKMLFSVVRTRQEDQYVLIDNVSIKPDTINCVKVSPLEQGRLELKQQWGIPLELLESVSYDVVTPHKKWFFPAEKPLDILYLPAERAHGKLTKAKREIVELGQRIPLNIKTIPLIRKVVSSTGKFSVNVMTFKKELSLYTLESLKAVSPAPKIVLLTEFDPNKHDTDLFDIFEDWQEQGTHFFFFDSPAPKELLGKKIPAPVLSVLPAMRNANSADLISWYQNGNSLTAVAMHQVQNNPAVPEEEISNARRGVRNFAGRDFLWWEYSMLNDIQALRFLAGQGNSVKLLAGNDKEITVQANIPWQGTAEVVWRNSFREEKAVQRIPVALATGQQSVSIPQIDLPGGIMIGEVRLLNKGGVVADAGAFRIDRPVTAPITVRFSNSDKIFPQGKPVEFSVSVEDIPAGSKLEVSVADNYERITVLQEVLAEKTRQFRLALPFPHTLLNNLLVRVKDKENKILSEVRHEFSTPLLTVDLKEFVGVTFGEGDIQRSAMGIDMGVGAMPNWSHAPARVRQSALLNIEHCLIGMHDFHKENQLYSGDKKTDPVRTPCFSDPAFQEEIRNNIKSFAERNNFAYYGLNHFMSGDEQYLGRSVCYSDHCLKGFRQYLQEQYEGIDALNKAWDRNFKSFEEVIPCQSEEIKNKSNLSPWLDHKMFMSRVYAKEQFGRFRDLLKPYAPGVKFGPSGTGQPGFTYDWWQISKYAGFFTYYGGTQVKLIHDFGGDGVRAGEWGSYCVADKDQEVYVYNPMWAGLIRGANMAALWPPSLQNGDLTPTRNFYHASRSLMELKGGIAKLWLSAKRNPEIGILYSQSSMFCAKESIGESEWQNSLSSWFKLIDDLKYDSLAISYEQLAKNGIPQDIKIMILPCAISLSDAEIHHLVEFVKGGGMVIADFAPGRFDGHGKRRGISSLDALFEPNSGEIISGFVHVEKYKGSFRLGEKAFGVEQRRKLGKGVAVNLNLVLGAYHNITLGGTGGELSTVKSADEIFQRTISGVVGKYLLEAGLQPQVKVTNSAGAEFLCQAILRQSGENQVLAIHKSGTEGARFDFSKAVPVTVTLPSNAFIYDIREGKYLGFTNKFKSSILSGWSRFYSLQKSKTERLEVKAPATITAGGEISVEFVAEGATGPQTFHVEVKNPAGDLQRIYSKNFHCNTPTGKYPMQIPFNAEKGTWQILVKHVDTGISTVKKVVVQ